MFCHIATIKDFIDYYYDYLSINMDGHVVSQLMVSKQLLNKCVVVNASHNYHKSCLILQQMRLMDMQTLETFAELLVVDSNQKHIGKMLIEGE